MQTDVPEIVDGGTAYIMICTVFSFGVFFQITIERLLQSTGKTFYTMITQILGTIANLILDPIFIFVLDMGVAGAAWATVAGEILGACAAAYLNMTRNPELSIKLRGFRPNGDIIRRIYAVGVPSIMMSSVGSVMTFCMNKILIGFTTTATAIFGVYFKLQSFVFMPVFGLNNGIVPIVAYNFGARKPERMTKTIRLGVIYAVSVMLAGFAVFQIFPDALLRLFDASDYMLEIGIPALRIISIPFVLAGFGIVCSSAFQALGHGVLSLIVSLVRQLVVLLPAAWLLSLSGRLELVWWSFPIAEVFSLVLSIVFLAYVFRKEVKPLTETPG